MSSDPDQSTDNIDATSMDQHRRTLVDVEALLFASVQTAFGSLNQTQHALIWEALTKVRAVLRPDAGYSTHGTLSEDFQVVGGWGVDSARDAAHGFAIIDQHLRMYPDDAGRCYVQRIDTLVFDDGSQFIAAPVTIERPTTEVADG